MAPQNNDEKLIEACKNGDLRSVEDLIYAQANIEHQDAIGARPLHCATLSGHWQVVRFLVDSEADIDAQTNTGRTALHFACGKNLVNVARYLLGRGAKHSVPDSKGRGALHYAAKQGLSAIVSLLLNEATEVDMKDEDGATPLHFAAQAPAIWQCGQSLMVAVPQAGSVDVCRALIRRGADTSIKTVDGRTALDTAANMETASVFDGRMELALERVKMMTRAAKDRAKMESDMRQQAEQGIEAMVDLIDAEREACADMERLVQEGQASLERDRRAREALETEVQAEEARKHSAEGWDQAWELDPEEVSLSDISVGGGNTSAVYLGFWQHLDVAELCEMDMAAHVKQGLRNHAPMEVGEVARHGIDLMLAVRYLHDKGTHHRIRRHCFAEPDESASAGLVHGAISTHKVMLDREGRSKLLYLPREALRAAPEYCGPEEDVFDCGAVLVEMARGSPVTSSDNYHIKQALADVPWPRLRDVCAKCLAQVPEERPSARAVIDMLRMCA